MLVTPTLFVTAVSGLIRMGAAGRKLFVERAQSRDIEVIVSLFEGDNSRFPMGRPQELQQLALVYASGFDLPILSPGGAFDLLFTPESVERGHTFDFVNVEDTPQRRDQVQTLIDRFFNEEIEARLDPEIRARIALDATADPRVTLLHKDWLTGDGPPRGWRRFGLELAGAALDVVGADPKMLGIDGKAEKLLHALLPNFNALVDAELLNQGGDEQFGERMIKTFMRGAMQAVTQHPDLVTSEERWKPVISSVLAPVVAEAEQSESGFVTQKRLGELLKGPVLHGALNAINDNADAFLKGDAKGDRVLGAVSRTLLSDLVSDPSRAIGLKDVFSLGGVVTIYNTALKTAAKRPDLFIRGDGTETEAARDMLRGLADTVKLTSVAPFRLADGTGSEIASIMFDVAADYTDQRIKHHFADGGDFDGVWSDVCSGLARDILSGFERGLAGKDVELFEKLFSRDQALDIFKIMATHIAATPQMITGERANPEVMHIAQSVAAAIAADEMKLMGAQDWRSLIGVMMTAASRNPGVLFSLDEDGQFTDQLATTLISHVLGKAQASMMVEGRAPGRVLFGETLREALIATLQAANTNLKASILTTSEDGGRSHISALGDFIDQLNHYSAQSGDPELAMTADEWLHVYKYFVAHVLENGQAATAQIGPNEVKAVLKDQHLNMED